MRKRPKSSRSDAHAEAEAFYKRWCAVRRECQVCGIGDREAQFKRFPGLSTHHVVKAGRKHEATNLIRLCQRCHDLAEGIDVPVWVPLTTDPPTLSDGTAQTRKVYYPKLRLPHVLFAKRYVEPEDYLPHRLAEILMRPLPEPEEPPAVFRVERLWRGGASVAARQLCDDTVDEHGLTVAQIMLQKALP